MNVHVCVWRGGCPQISQRNPGLILGKLHERSYHCSEVLFTQTSTEAAVKPTKYRRQEISGKLEGQQMLAKVIQQLSSSPLSLNSFPCGPMAPFPPLKVSKSPDHTRSLSPYFSRPEFGMISRSFTPLWGVVKREYTQDPQPRLIISCHTTNRLPM